MTLESPASSLPPHPALHTDTFTVFLPGEQVYIQSAARDAQLLALGELAGTEPAALRVRLSWDTAQAMEGGKLEPGQLVRLSTGEKRILYVAEGRVLEAELGEQNSALIELPAKCAGYNRRRHPRYELNAYITIGSNPSQPEFAPAIQVPVDLSMGGFGLRLPAPAWPVGTRVHFQLEVQSGMTSSGLTAVPAIRLEGEAEIRRHVAEPGGIVLLGCEFYDMSGYRSSVLGFWLDTFHVYLRES